MVVINARNVNFLILPISENSTSLSFPPGRCVSPPPSRVTSGRGGLPLYTQGTCPGCAVFPATEAGAAKG